MSSYLGRWLSLRSPSLGLSTPQPPPAELRISPPPEIEVEDADEDDDEAPAFPSLDSIQRTSVASASTRATNEASGIPRILTDPTLMPPPLSLPTPRPSTNSTSLMPPPTTTKAPTSLTPKAKKRVKVALTPGHSMMDWGALKSSGKDLRGVDSLMRVTPSILKQHNKRDDAWSSFNGKVYNITPYIEFHPGGEKELLRVAGRDGTKLFAATHAWVNVDFMLDACLVGFMVSEPAS